MEEIYNENNENYTENVQMTETDTASVKTAESAAAPMTGEGSNAPETFDSPAAQTTVETPAAQETSNIAANRPANNFDPYTGRPLNNNGNQETSNPDGPVSFTYGSGVQDAYSYTASSQETYGGTAEPQSTYTYGTTYRYPQDGTLKKAKKERKGLPRWLKVGIAAISFGVLAAGTFICTNSIYNKFISSQVPSVTEDAANEKQSDKSTPGQDQIGRPKQEEPEASQVKNTKPGKATTDTTIPSTDVLINGETTFYDLSGIVENVMPSIVQITCTFNTQSFFGTYQSTGAGSGIIIKQSDDELLIATNNHVIEDALSITVTFGDDKEVTGYTKGTDATADLAVVAVKISDIDKDTMNNIKVATLGDSDSVKVGQMAIAIGNALGYGTSTTVGYISAIDREVKVDGKTMTLLQTDAAINPGNSGGALLNIYGEVIGINSVKYASDEVEGMGFAIPISRAMSILDNLANREVLKDSEKGYLGIYMRNVTSDIANAYNWPMGIYVSEIVEGSPADKSDLLVGDIITAINGINVQTSTDLRNEITSYRAGTTVKLTVSRLSKGRFSEEEIEVTLTTNPDYSD